MFFFSSSGHTGKYISTLCVKRHLKKIKKRR